VSLEGVRHRSTGCQDVLSLYLYSTASYYNAVVDGKTIKDAAWYVPHFCVTNSSSHFDRYYPETKEKANEIKGYVAFYKVRKMPLRHLANNHTHVASEQSAI
jgi:uncharacterized protein (DUF427 family)